MTNGQCALALWAVVLTLGCSPTSESTSLAFDSGTTFSDAALDGSAQRDRGSEDSSMDGAPVDSGSEPDSAVDYRIADDGAVDAGMDGGPPPQAGIIPVVQISAGRAAFCARYADGVLRCQGADIATDPGFLDVSVGGAHICALDSTGHPQCWLDDCVDCPGDGHGQADAPRIRLTTLASGTVHTCGLAPDGRLFCWGAGNGGWEARGQADAPAGQFTSVVSGRFHSCALDAAGQANCWGADDRGDRIDLGQVDPVAGPFVQLAAGNSHTCGLTAEGEVRCWGEAGPVPRDVLFSAIDASGATTCGIRRSDRKVQCWQPPFTDADNSAPDVATDSVAVGTPVCVIRDDGWAECGEGEAPFGPHPALFPARGSLPADPSFERACEAFCNSDPDCLRFGDVCPFQTNVANAWANGGRCVRTGAECRVSDCIEFFREAPQPLECARAFANEATCVFDDICGWIGPDNICEVESEQRVEACGEADVAPFFSLNPKSRGLREVYRPMACTGAMLDDIEIRMSLGTGDQLLTPETLLLPQNRVAAEFVEGLEVEFRYADGLLQDPDANALAEDEATSMLTEAELTADGFEWQGGLPAEGRLLIVALDHGGGWIGLTEEGVDISRASDLRDERIDFLRSFVDRLPETDRLALVSFNSEQGVQLDVAPTDNRATFLDGLSALERGENGGTPLADGLSRALAILTEDGAPGAILLVTDGSEEADPSVEALSDATAAIVEAQVPLLVLHKRPPPPLRRDRILELQRGACATNGRYVWLDSFRDDGRGDPPLPLVMLDALVGSWVLPVRANFARIPANGYVLSTTLTLTLLERTASWRAGDFGGGQQDLRLWLAPPN